MNGYQIKKATIAQTFATTAPLHDSVFKLPLAQSFSYKSTISPAKSRKVMAFIKWSCEWTTRRVT